MSLVTELSAEQWFVKAAGVTLKCQGTISVDLTLRKANGRGSGDAAPRPKVIGLDDGAGIGFQFISSNTAMMTYHGLEVTNCDVLDDSTSLLGAFTGLFEVAQLAGDVNGMVQFNARITPLEPPSIISHIDY